MSVTEAPVTERIFASFKPDKSTFNANNPGDPESYAAWVDMMIKDARDYEQSYLAGNRNRATAYYYGLLPNLAGDDRQIFSEETIVQNADATYEDIVNREDIPNRSTFVSTDVRDAVLQVLPSLVRIFGASENVVTLVPRTEQQIDSAEQGQDYTNYTFWNDNSGFLILYGAFKDAMTVKTGFVKWWTDDVKEKRYKTFQNITMEQTQFLMSEGEGVEVHDMGNMDPTTNTIDRITFRYTTVKPVIKVMGVPPEEMRLDRNARTFATSRITGHERVVPIDELVAIGYDRDLCANFIQSTDTHNFTQESQMRNPGRATNTRVDDGVNYGEFYIRVDKDGDGSPELRYVCTMGEDNEIVKDEPANRIKFAVFSPDPISHTIVGDSLADLIIDMQRIKTNMFRGVLDSLVESINPKSVVNEMMVNMDDVLNDDLGAVIRTRGDPNAAIAYTLTPFAGQAAVPVIQMINDTLQRRTGLTDAAKGLDPKALQSSTMIGVDAIISGAAERIELIARCLAETGFKDLFVGIYNEICENPSQQRVLRIRGKFTAFDTSTFDASMGVEVNPTLGKGTDQVRIMALQGIKQDQQNLVAQMGLNNPICGIPEMYNTITDMLSIANIKNVNRYFKMPDPQTLAAMQSAPKEPDPMTVAAKAQYEKVKSDTSKALGQQQFQEEKLAKDDAFRREQELNKTNYEQQRIELEAKRIEQEHEAALAKVASQHVIGVAKVAVDKTKAEQGPTGD